ncbi:hypothetical protein ABZY34_04815, partial [Streptomyces virginiae]|uniref:hypothetical protein n=1 Tax=Streptomyces virginiae TaxID=1961 RepID=UPI0033A52EDA
TARVRAERVKKTDTSDSRRDRDERGQQKNAGDVAESDKKARKSNADPLYQQARKECGGYDTCVAERTRKLREQEKGTTKGHADKGKRNQDDTGAQNSQKTAASKKKTDTSDRRSNRDDRGQQKNTGPVKNKYGNKAV